MLIGLVEPIRRGVLSTLIVVPSLFLKDGPLAGRRVPVTAELLIGRADADLTIDDPLVSRRHALVRPAPGGGDEIEDLGSTNGTWVNGERIDGLRREIARSREDAGLYRRILAERFGIGPDAT